MKIKNHFFKKSTLATAILIVLMLQAYVGAALFVTAAPTPEESNIHISGGGSMVIAWKSGKSRTYSSDTYVSLSGLYSVAFVPNHGWHIDAVIIDGNSQGILDTDGFTLINVRVKSTISVSFLENGGVDDVKSGSDVEAYPDPYVGLIFDKVLINGFVYAYTIELAYAQPPNATSESWDIQTDASFIPNVTVILVLALTDLRGTDPAWLRLLTTEPELARSDFDSDGRVSGTDVSTVAYANPSKPGDPRYDPRLDMNNDGLIDDQDVNIVNNYNEQIVWKDITLQVIVGNDLVYVYGVTNHFSIFGISSIFGVSR